MIREQNAKCKQIIDAFNPYKNPYPDNNPYLKIPFRFVKYCIFGFIASLTAFIILNTVLYDDLSPEMVLPLIGSINKSALSRVFFFQTIFFFGLLFLLKNFNRSDEICASECEDLDMALIAESK